jgi:hypothetical protein
MTKHAYCANRYNVETRKWEYAPRYVTVERGQITARELEQSCATCHLDQYGHGNLCEGCHAHDAIYHQRPAKGCAHYDEHEHNDEENDDDHNQTTATDRPNLRSLRPTVRDY